MLACCALFAFAASGCSAQNPPSSSVNRRIEVLVRSQFNVPSNYEVILGTRTKSDVPGYDNLPVTFSHSGKQTTVPFLISSDGNTFARLEKFDISKDPQDTVSTDKRPVRGTPGAKVTIVNFDDLECPYCARMHEELFPTTLDHYKGLVRVIYKDYPLVEIHPWAMHAAVNANCLAAQNDTAYWDYVDYLHSHGEEISGSAPDPAKSFLALDTAAREQGTKAHLSMDKLNACIQKQDPAPVRPSMHEAEALGIEGTPQVFVNGERIAGGARPIDELWDAIDRALKADGVQPPQRSQPSGASGTGVAAPGTTHPATTPKS